MTDFREDSAPGGSSCDRREGPGTLDGGGLEGFGRRPCLGRGALPPIATPCSA